MNSKIEQQEDIRNKVREGYRSIAIQEESSCCGPSSCCSSDSGDDAEQLAQVIGYSAEDLSALPEGANMGLSCGNPTALASLKPGETVVDLGSGGGFDVFIAGRKVGAAGKAIGVDMTHEMLSKARKNLQVYQEQTGFENVEFRLGEIEYLPLPDNSADVVISNCVINLSPNKPQVWREIFRVLKPGGRVAVSDMALLKPLPESISGMVEALIGCVAGAMLIDETKQILIESGYENIVLDSQTDYIDAMADSKDSLYKSIKEGIPAGEQLSDYICSLKISAIKPGKSDCCC